MIEASNLCFMTSDTGEQILKGISLSIRAGDRIGITGSSGSGKSTLGFHLCGLHKNALVGTSTGSLVLNGRECIDRDYPGFAGIVLQNPETQLFCETVREEIALGPENMGKTGHEVQAITDRMLRLFNLEGFSDSKVSTLSHGLKQRLSIASMLAVEPRVLLLDEPTNFLDTPSSDRLFETLKRLNEHSGLIVIVIEHNDERLASFASRIVRLENGRVAAIECPRKTRSAPHRRARAGSVRKVPARTERAVEIRGLSFGYDKRRMVINDFSLDFYCGEITAILGENGSGKTTLLKLIKGLLKPGRGSITTAGDGRPMDTVSLVFQDPDSQLFAHSVEEECGYLLKNRKTPHDEINRRVDAILGSLGLGGTNPRLPFTLSYGEKRRLTIASMLVGECPVVCLDEPTVALDWQNLEILGGLLSRLASENKSVIFSTHDLRFASRTADRFITLKDGALACDSRGRVS